MSPVARGADARTVSAARSSFDVVDPMHNEWLYADLNERVFGSAARLNFSAPRAWFKPMEALRLSQLGGEPRTK